MNAELFERRIEKEGNQGLNESVFDELLPLDVTSPFDALKLCSRSELWVVRIRASIKLVLHV